MKMRQKFNIILLFLIVLLCLNLVTCASKGDVRNLRNHSRGRNNKHSNISTLATTTLKPEISNDPIDTSSSIKDHENIKHFNLKKCGVSLSKGINFSYNARFLSHPWIARLVYTKNERLEYGCGGTLISQHYVLTSAFCLKEEPNRKLTKVRLGEYDITKAIDCDPNDDEYCVDPFQDIEIEKKILHPDYKVIEKNKHVASIQNDIGLIRLKTAAKVSQSNIQSICLPFEKESIEPNKNYIIIGWGRIENNTSPKILQEGFPKPLDLRDCQSRFQSIGISLNNKQLCAGDFNTTDAYLGDLGGPLLSYSYINQKPRVVQFGIVSYNVVDGSDEKFPGIFTNVHPYLNWILDNVY